MSAIKNAAPVLSAMLIFLMLLSCRSVHARAFASQLDGCAV